MTEGTTAIVVAAIAAIPPTAVAVVTLIVALRNKQTTGEVKQTLDVLHTQINGKMEQLLEQKGIAARAEGKAEGVEAERSRPPDGTT